MNDFEFLILALIIFVGFGVITICRAVSILQRKITALQDATCAILDVIVSASQSFSSYARQYYKDHPSEKGESNNTGSDASS